MEERPQQLAEVLERRAPQWRGWAVVPANDGALAALAQHRERASSLGYRVIAPPADVTRRLLDKESMLAAARETGLDVPHCYGSASVETASRSDLRYPVLVKPSVGYRFFTRFGCKLLAARDAAELTACVARMEEAGSRGEVFDFVPGGDDRIYAYATYLDGRGEPRGGLTVRKIRQSPPLFGVARVAEVAPPSAHDALLRDATIALCRRMGLRGIAVAEFKLDERDGRMRFLEINGRSVIYNGLLRRAGLDCAWLAYSEHVLGEVPASLAIAWPGVWIHFHADLLYALLRRDGDNVGFSEFIAPYRRPKTYAVWSATDPMPFIAEWARSARMQAVRLLRDASREHVSAPTRCGEPAVCEVESLTERSKHG
jgi:predicted ATP-grasp superfamily ATP-dependent carboligase